MRSKEARKTVVKKSLHQCLFAMAFVVMLAASAFAQSADAKPEHVQTIVVIRHGEKPHGGLGQLSCMGLNRGLALPKILIEKYGKPDFIFAPNPLPTMKEGETRYAYVRPLATIEPTAVQLAMPINASIGFNDIKGLEKELSLPQYHDAVVFVAWEHIMAQHFAENMMAVFGGDIRQVPEWEGDDYDSIYVVRVARTGHKTSITFTLDHEGLNQKLPKTCPTVSPM